MIDKKIIRPWFGGLGDSLQHSWMPRRFKEMGYRVFLSAQTPFRNPDIKKLVWDLNPHLSGVDYDQPNCGDLGGHLQYTNWQEGFIGNWQKVHGLHPPYDKYPEIYYEPKLVEWLKDVTLVDFSCVSLWDDYVKKDMAQYFPEDAMMMEFAKSTNETDDRFFQFKGGHKGYYTYNIFQYADAIYSCKKFMCLFAGGAVLASALQKYRQLDVECYIVDCPRTKSAEMQGLYFFDNIKYIWI